MIFPVLLFFFWFACTKADDFLGNSIPLSTASNDGDFLFDELVVRNLLDEDGTISSSNEDDKAAGGGKSFAYEPRFVVESFIPKKSNLRESEPLAVVFNIPVVPLGADLLTESDKTYKMPIIIKANNKSGTVPGRGYWVTTSIYRWEPEIKWSKDLDVTVSIDPELTSLSGQELNKDSKKWKDNSVRNYLTPNLTYFIENVTSEEASKKLNKRWSSRLIGSEDPLADAHEILPDGKAVLCFDENVNIQHFKTAELSDRFLRIFKGDNILGGFVDYNAEYIDVRKNTSHSPIGRHEEKSDCIELSFAKPLLTGFSYTLQLKKGFIYNDKSGPYLLNDEDSSSTARYLSHRSIIQFTGIRRFKIYGVKELGRSHGLSYRRLRVHLVHGLSEDVTLDEFNKQIILMNDNLKQMPFEGSFLGKTTYVLDTNVMPNTAYTLIVSANSEIKDIFGLPLESSKINFLMGKASGFIMSPSSNIHYNFYDVESKLKSDGSLDFNIPFLSPQPSVMSFTQTTDLKINITPVSLNLGDSTENISSYFANNPVDQENTITLDLHNEHETASTYPEAMKVSIPNVFDNPTHIFQSIRAVKGTYKTRTTANSTILSVLPVYTSYVLARDTSMNQLTLIVEVVDLKSNKGVENAEIDVYVNEPDFSDNSNQKGVIKKLKGTNPCVSNSSGLCEIQFLLPNEIKSSSTSIFYSIKLPNRKGLYISDIMDCGRLNESYDDSSKSLTQEVQFDTEVVISKDINKLLKRENLAVSFTTDRAIYKPGDKFVVKGYAVAVSTKQNPLCVVEDNTNNINVVEDNINNNKLCLIHEAIGVRPEKLGIFMNFVFQNTENFNTLDSFCFVIYTKLDDFGAFQFEGEVPPNAHYIPVPSPDVSLFLYPDEETDSINIDVASNKCAVYPIYESIYPLRVTAPHIIIADPRPPSVILDASVPSVISPDDSITVTGSVVTYTGNPLNNYELTVTFSLSRFDAYGKIVSLEYMQSSDETNIYSDEARVYIKQTSITDSEGKFKVSLKLSEIFVAENISKNANDIYLSNDISDGKDFEDNMIRRKLIQGEILEVTVFTIGLFGDVIKSSIFSVSLSKIPYYLGPITFSPLPILPGVSVSVSTTIESYATVNNPTATRLDNNVPSSIQYTVLRLYPEKPIITKYEENNENLFYGGVFEKCPYGVVETKDDGSLDIDKMMATGKFVDIVKTCNNSNVCTFVNKAEYSTSEYVVLAQVTTEVGSSVRCSVLRPVTFVSSNRLYIAVRTDKTEYNDNEEVLISFVNPFVISSTLLPSAPADAMLRVLITWASYPPEYMVREIPFRNLIVSKIQNITLNAGIIPFSCGTDCGLNIIISTPASETALLEAVVKTDLLLNTKAPFYSSNVIYARKAMKNLADISSRVSMQITDGKNIVKNTFSPGEKVYLTLNVSNMIEVDDLSQVTIDVDRGKELLDDIYDYEAQVTFIVVDKRMLDLKVFPMMNVSSAFNKAEPSLHFVSNTMLGHISSYDAHMFLQDKIYRRLIKEPWTDIFSWPVLPLLYGGGENVWYNLSDEDHLKSLYAELTVFPESDIMQPGVKFRDVVSVGAFRTSSAAAVDDPNQVDLSEARTKSPHYVRSDITVLAAFTTSIGLLTKSDGKNKILQAKTDFTLHSNTGTFVVRAYAVVKKKLKNDQLWKTEGSTLPSKPGFSELFWGTAEQNLQSKLPMCLKGYLPRVIRSTDVGLFGVVLYADADELLSKKTFSIKIIDVNGVSVEEAEKEKRFKLRETVEDFMFKYSANKGVGDASVVFALYDVTDALNVVLIDQISENISIIPFSPMTTVATFGVISPMLHLNDDLQAVDSSGCQTRETGLSNFEFSRYINLKEGLAIPSMDLSVGGVSITSSVDHVGTITSMAKNLIYSDAYFSDIVKSKGAVDKSKSFPSGRNVLLLILTTHFLEISYGIKDETILLVAQEAKRLVHKYFPPPQYSYLGFLPMAWGEMNDDVEHSRLNYSLSSFAYYVLKKTRIMILGKKLDALASSINKEIIHAASECHSLQNVTLLEYLGTDTVAELRNALGSMHKFGLLKNDEGDISFENLVRKCQNNFVDKDLNITVCSLFVADLVLRENIEQYKNLVSKYVSNMIDNHIHIQGRKAFVGSSNGVPFSATVQALALLVWARNVKFGSHITDSDANLMTKLSAYVAEIVSTKDGLFGGLFGNSLGIAVEALNVVDRALNNILNVNMSLIATLDSDRDTSDTPICASLEELSNQRTILMQRNFSNYQRGPYTSQYDWKTLVESYNMQVDATNGKSSNIIKFYAAGEGSVLISVSMKLILNETTISPSYRGILVEKTLRKYDRTQKKCVGGPIFSIVSSDYVCVTVTVTVRDSLRAVVIEDMCAAGLEPIGGVFDKSEVLINFDILPICTREVMKASVVWKCPYLYPGTHEYTYVAIANLPGIYALSPATAFEASEGVTMGNSVGVANGFVVLSKQKSSELKSVDEIYKAFNLTKPEFTERIV